MFGIIINAEAVISNVSSLTIFEPLIIININNGDRLPKTIIKRVNPNVSLT